MNLNIKLEIIDFLSTFFLSYYYSITSVPLSMIQKSEVNKFIDQHISDLFHKQTLNYIMIGRICIGKFSHELMNFCILQAKQVDKIEDYIECLAHMHETVIYSVTDILLEEFKEKDTVMLYGFPIAKITNIEHIVELSSSMFTIFICDTCKELYLFSKDSSLEEIIIL